MTDAEGRQETIIRSFATRAYYIGGYSPATVTALNECDTLNKGDFELKWNVDGTDRTANFDLGAGDSHTVSEFATSMWEVHYDTPVPFKLELRENDPPGAFLFAPWKWEPMKFRGGSSSLPGVPVHGG